MTEQHPALPLTPTRPEANAVVFPLILGVTLDKETAQSSKGTHFFTYHFVFRVATDGESDPQIPMVGFPGPDMKIIGDSNIPQFPFVSSGGAGQKGGAYACGRRRGQIVS